MNALSSFADLCSIVGLVLTILIYIISDNKK